MNWGAIGVIIGVIGIAFGAGVFVSESGTNISNLSEFVMQNKEKLSKIDSVKTPSGAVVAFNLATCPNGWSEFDIAKGRTIIGSGNGNGLTAHGLGAVGGSEKYQLTISELPKHQHTEAIHSCSGGGTSWGYLRNHSNSDCSPQVTSEVGNSNPFNIMQPFVALLYCKKN